MCCSSHLQMRATVRASLYKKLALLSSIHCYWALVSFSQCRIRANMGMNEWMLTSRCFSTRDDSAQHLLSTVRRVDNVLWFRHSEQMYAVMSLMSLALTPTQEPWNQREHVSHPMYNLNIQRTYKLSVLHHKETKHVKEQKNWSKDLTFNCTFSKNRLNRALKKYAAEKNGI